MHARRLAEDYLQRHLPDRVAAEQRVGHGEVAVAGDFADDGMEAALAAGEALEALEVGGPHHQHVALLRLVAPDLHRAHARVVVGDRPQVEAGPLPLDQLRAGVRQPAGADVVDADDGVGVPEGDAAADQLLAAALHLRVVPLHRGEVEVGEVAAAVHARGVAAPQADQHRRPAELHHPVPRLGLLLLDLPGGDQADPAGHHDRLVVAAVAAGRGLLEGAEEAEDVGAAELVAEGGAAEGAFGHDLQRRRQALRELGEVALPGLRESGDAQVGGVEGAEPGLGLAADAGRPLVADLAADAGRGPGEGGDRRRVVVGLHLAKDVAQLVAVAVGEGALRAGAEGRGAPALDDAGVVGVRLHRPLRAARVGVADHGEQGALAPGAVDGPAGVEDLVAAVLGVDVGEHHQLDVGRVAPETGEGVEQVADLVAGQGEAHLPVGPLQGRGPFGEGYPLQGPRGDLGEEGVVVMQHRLGHAVVQQGQQGGRGERAVGEEPVLGAPLDAGDRGQAAVAQDVGRLGRPGGDGPGAGGDADGGGRAYVMALGGGAARPGGVAEDQGLQAAPVAALPVDEVEMARLQPPDRGLGLPAALQQRLPAEIGQGVAAGEPQDVHEP